MLLPTRFDQVGGRAVRFARIGQGPPIVMLHGYPDNLQLWSEVAPLLAARFDVIAVDWPGMGMSEAWAGGASPFDMAARLIALFDHWKIARAALVGADMGGQPALVAAARHPDRISHVVVTGSLLQWDAATSWEIKLLRTFRFNQFVLKTLPRLVFERALRTFLPNGHAIDAHVRDDFWQAFRRPDVRAFIVRMCAGYQGTLQRVAHEYAGIAAPTLALWGARDAHFPPVHALRLKDQVRDAEVQIVEDGEHWLPLQAQHVFAERVAAFLTR